MKQYKRIKPSLSDLSMDEQLDLHRRIRASRLISKAPITRRTKTTPKQKRNKKLNKLVKDMSPEELKRLEKLLGNSDETEN